MREPNDTTHYELAQQDLTEFEYTSPAMEEVKSGKVRNLYALRGVVFETTNRISVFDRVIMENVPLKGAMLNCISQYNKHLLSELGFATDFIPVSRSFFEGAGIKPEDTNRYSYAEGLTMLPFEFIVRGFLVGSAYKAYKKGEPYCGFTFPEGMKEGDKLPEPIVTPTTKEEDGHDRPVTKYEMVSMLAEWFMDNGMSEDPDDLYEEFDGDFAACEAELSEDLSEEAIAYAEDIEDEWERMEYQLAYQAAMYYVDEAYDMSLEAFKILCDMCAEVGILFIDTKFEFGLNADGDIVLGDEVGTPDSSRFAPADEYAATGKIVSMDKQIVRDYASSVGFTGDPDEPLPVLPDELVKQVTDTYVKIAELICGKYNVTAFL